LAALKGSKHPDATREATSPTEFPAACVNNLNSSFPIVLLYYSMARYEFAKIAGCALYVIFNSSSGPSSIIFSKSNSNISENFFIIGDTHARSFGFVKRNLPIPNA